MNKQSNCLSVNANTWGQQLQEGPDKWLMSEQQQDTMEALSLDCAFESIASVCMF
jgi:hypothetical protein